MAETGLLPDEKTPEQVAAIERGMAAEGQPTHFGTQDDYFGFDDTQNVMLPDNISFITIKALNEGERVAYQDAIQKDLKLQRATGDAILKLAGGSDRRQLLIHSIVGWNLARQGKPVGFSKGSPGSTLEQWLQVAPPHIIDKVEKAVHKKNPWLMADMKVEDVDKQIEELMELRERLVREQEGNASSSGK